MHIGHYSVSMTNISIFKMALQHIGPSSALRHIDPGRCYMHILSIIMMFSRKLKSNLSRVVESELGVGGVACFQLESGVGFQNCWSRSRFFKTAGVGRRSRFIKTAGVGRRSRFFKTAGVGSRSRFFKTAGVGTFVAITDSNVQCLLNNLNYNINCLKIITGYWQYWLYSECP